MEGILKIVGDGGAKDDFMQAVNNGLPQTDVDATVVNIVNFLLYAAGLLAVVMIIVAGVKMTTSAGDAGAVAKAKSTIIYSVVGLVVVILAYAIVNFVIGAMN
ncbi:hypothetical protein IJG98_03235 [Candidatus Saccharibacteria bacterium]|nr:hypothetical protein [Candidatus Saccharibacteria bacterium]